MSAVSMSLIFRWTASALLSPVPIEQHQGGAVSQVQSPFDQPDDFLLAQDTGSFLGALTSGRPRYQCPAGVESFCRGTVGRPCGAQPCREPASSLGSCTAETRVLHRRPSVQETCQSTRQSP